MLCFSSNVPYVVLFTLIKNAIVHERAESGVLEDPFRFCLMISHQASAAAEDFKPR